MTEIQNLNKHAIVCMIIFLLMVLFFLQPRVFSQLFQTILGRAFLVILIVYITYCNQIWGVLFVLFLMIMHTNDSTLVEGFSPGLKKKIDQLTDKLKEQSKEKERNQAAVDAMASVNGSSDPHKIFLKSAATIAQNYNNENPNPPFFSIMPAKIKLLEEVRAAKAANSPTALSTAQLNYLEALAKIAEQIANNNKFSKEAVAFKKAQNEEMVASIKAEPRPMASTSQSSFAPTSTVNPAPVTTTTPVITTTVSPVSTSSVQQAQVQTDTQAREDAKNLIKTLTPSPTQSDTSILTQIKKTCTCTENFKPLEGFDLLGLEDNMKRGKQSNSIQVENSYHQNSEDVMPYEKSFFSPFQF